MEVATERRRKSWNETRLGCVRTTEAGPYPPGDVRAEGTGPGQDRPSQRAVPYLPGGGVPSEVGERALEPAVDLVQRQLFVRGLYDGLTGRSARGQGWGQSRCREGQQQRDI